MRKKIINTKDEQIDTPVADTSAHNWEDRYEPLPIDCSNEDEGGSSDPQKNLLWFIKKAKEGNAYAQLLLYDIYTDGDEDIPQDHAEALKWLRRCANQKHPDAQSKLGYAYAMGIGVKKNLKTAVKWWKLAAKQGFAESQYNLGNCCYKGDGVPQNYEDAVKWWKLAVSQDHFEALNNLVYVYQKILVIPLPEEYGQILAWSKLLREKTAA